MYDYIARGWTFLKINSGGEIFVKVFCSDYDDWRMNSGCTKITLIENGYEVDGFSGSKYFLSKYGENKLSRFAESTLMYLLQNYQEQGMYAIERIDLHEAKRILNAGQD